MIVVWQKMCLKTTFCWMDTLKRRFFEEYEKKKSARFCFGLGNMHFSEKNYRKLQICCCRSSWSRKIVRFVVPLFSQYSETMKGTKYMLKKSILVCLRNYLESIEVTALLCTLTYFHFAWKRTLRPNNSVQTYNSVECQRIVDLKDWREKQQNYQSCRK